MSFKQDWSRLYERIRGNIFELAAECQFSPTPQQADLMRAYYDDQRSPEPLRRYATKSGQGTGKTTVSTLFGLDRALLDVGAMVVVTAPTMRQCTDVWIAELRRLLSKANPILRRFIEVFNTSVVIGGIRDWGIRCVTATRPENMQGYHQKYLTFILEEASGIDRPIWQQIKGTVSNENSCIFAIGNPNSQQCEFFDCFNKNRHLWITNTFNSEQSPLVDKRNIELLAEEYGRDSDVYRVRVLGEFPHSDPHSIMTLDDLEACTKVDMRTAIADPRGKSLYNGTHGRQIGIDLARFGSDESVVVARSGLAVVRKDHFSKREPLDVIEHAFRIQADMQWRDQDVIYVVDAGGMGQGVMSHFYRAGKRVHEFHTQGTAGNPAYADKMSQAWFELGKLVRERVVRLPNDPRLISQLSTRQYVCNRSDGKLKVESKDDYLKREPMGEETSSPDRADATVMAFFRGSTAGAKM